jgi:hypothetical protein
MDEERIHEMELEFWQSHANAHLADTEPETVEPEWDGEYDLSEPF